MEGVPCGGFNQYFDVYSPIFPCFLNYLYSYPLGSPPPHSGVCGMVRCTSVHICTHLDPLASTLVFFLSGEWLCHKSRIPTLSLHLALFLPTPGTRALTSPRRRSSHGVGLETAWTCFWHPGEGVWLCSSPRQVSEQQAAVLNQPVACVISVYNSGSYIKDIFPLSFLGHQQL